MKKFIKLMSLSTAAFLLVACNNGGQEAEPAQESVSSVVESQDQASSQESSSQSLSSDAAESSHDEDTQADDTTGESVKFAFYVSGQEAPVAEYDVNLTEGMNVLEAMEASKDQVPFNFNEEEGVIDSINDIDNDYLSGQTWTYLLNGQFAEAGVVSQTLKAGDTIQWYFGTIDEIPVTIIPAEDVAGDTDLTDTEEGRDTEGPAALEDSETDSEELTNN
ncbi:DUF4430 domain-containing protein [Hutsoniella sourekii]|uniref:DUF4430 domain-containing protein n=1 Tax=Hutsoniella sourekii TaxID=87650 RepID=UPI0004BB750D|nr:DUF4430 domain-containing protein [Hutsoniella sourekii]